MKRGVRRISEHVARARQVDRELADRMRRGPRGEHHDAIGERDRLLEVVGDEDDALAVGAPELEQLVLHQLARLDVERGEGLVHEQDLRVEDQHLRERRALAHASRRAGAGSARRIPASPTRASQSSPAPARLARSHAAELQARRDVGERAAPRHQRLGLEHVARAPVDARERLAEDAHRARRGLEQARGDVEQRGLAAARGPHDRDELALADGERHVLHRRVRAHGAAPGEGAGDAVEFDGGR